MNLTHTLIFSQNLKKKITTKVLRNKRYCGTGGAGVIGGHCSAAHLPPFLAALFEVALSTYLCARSLPGRCCKGKICSSLTPRFLRTATFPAEQRLNKKKDVLTTILKTTENTVWVAHRWLVFHRIASGVVIGWSHPGAIHGFACVGM